MFFVYILKSRVNKKYYIGYTGNLIKRVKDHNGGKNISTKNGEPWDLIYSEFFQTKAEAWKRERQIKSYKSGEAFKKLIKYQ